ncbi:MAG: NAD(P)/FAD-dependent oxidoreductase [Mycoplasma sp.]|nr:NAD(P)/FAD-dependent oxidoreductase [Candidatus Hennigella equi]
MKIYDIAIIGGGPGGLYAHYYAHQNKLSSILIEANNELGGQPTILFPIKAIHDYPGWESIQASELMNDFIKKADLPDVVLNTSVNKIEQADGCYQLVTNKEPIYAKFVIIATGGGFFKFNKIDGIESDKIHYVVKDINLYKDKKVIIAGGGDAALDWAAEILKRHLTNDLSIVHRRDQFRACRTKVSCLKEYEYKTYLNKSSKVIADGKLEIIDKVTNEKEVLPFDYLIVQYGQSYSLQDNQMLKPFNLDLQNRIKVDAKCRTNMGNIYAIGNVASYNDKPRLIHVAVSDAKKAIDDILNHE